MITIECPRCSASVEVDEERRAAGGKLRLTCEACGTRFAMRLQRPDLRVEPASLDEASEPSLDAAPPMSEDPDPDAAADTLTERPVGQAWAVVIEDVNPNGDLGPLHELLGGLPQYAGDPERLKDVGKRLPSVIGGLSEAEAQAIEGALIQLIALYKVGVEAEVLVGSLRDLRTFASDDRRSVDDEDARASQADADGDDEDVVFDLTDDEDEDEAPGEESAAGEGDRRAAPPSDEAPAVLAADAAPPGSAEVAVELVDAPAADHPDGTGEPAAAAVEPPPMRRTFAPSEGDLSDAEIELPGAPDDDDGTVRLSDDGEPQSPPTPPDGVVSVDPDDRPAPRRTTPWSRGPADGATGRPSVPSIDPAASDVLVTNLTSLPDQRVEPIGLVTHTFCRRGGSQAREARRRVRAFGSRYRKALEVLAREAEELGADAVIGVELILQPTGEGDDGVVWAIVQGTACRRLPG